MMFLMMAMKMMVIAINRCITIGSTFRNSGRPRFESWPCLHFASVGLLVFVIECYGKLADQFGYIWLHTSGANYNVFLY